MGEADLQRVLDRLPHGSGFRFVTAVTDLEPGAAGAAVWRVTGAEWFFESHFPGEPVVPGVLITEALAQVAGLVAYAGGADGAGPVARARLAHVDVKFTGAVRPPAEIVLRARVSRRLGPLVLLEVRAECGGAAVATGTLTLAAVAGEEST